MGTLTGDLEPVRVEENRLGVLVQRYRQAAGWSQLEVADRAGLSVGSLRDLEQGRVMRPRPETLRRLADALRLPEADLAELTRLRQCRPARASRLRIRVLGPLTALVDGAVVDPGSSRQRALLGLLAVCANRPVGLDALAEVLWDGQPPPAAAELIRTRVSRLRQRLRSKRVAWQPLVFTGGGYQLTVADEDLDLLEFRRHVERARSAEEDGEVAASFVHYQRALRLWQGELLPDLPQLRVQPVITDLEREWRSVVLAFAEQAAALRQHGRALPLLRRLTDAEPLDEAAHARLIVALCGSGEPAAALAAYDQLRRRLADELGVDPGPDLQRLYQAMLRSELGTATAHVVEQPAAASRAVPAQLPPPPAGFTGRRDHLAQLDGILTGARRVGAVAICVLSGTAGAGKTALALHWAHRVRHGFPDGQLHVNLRGFAPDGAALTPDEAVRVFLQALGVPGEQIPSHPDAQVALYRSLLADRRILVVLDNAADASQVRPLLPGSPGCLALLTSRSQLTGLVATEGASAVPVQLLSTAESRQLLATRLGADRVAAEPQAVDEIVALCARLPLALAVVAARAASHPDLPLHAFAAKLGQANDKLAALGSDDVATDVQAVLSWSYRELTPPAARLFRLLGLHPGPDMDAHAAASLAGVEPAAVEPLLEELTQAHLLAMPSAGRYGLHDLLRAYASKLAAEIETEPGKRAATRRLLDHYIHTADAADRTVYPHRDRIGLPPPEPNTAIARFTDVSSALAWVAAERQVLLAAVRDAAAARFDRHTCQLALTLLDFFHRNGHWHDWVASHQIALASAQRLGDPKSQAHLHHSLGRAFAQMRRYREAHRHLRHAIELFHSLFEDVGEGGARLSLSYVLSAECRDDEALAHDLRALQLYRTACHRSGQANALNSLGYTYGELGDYERALKYCQEALVLQRELSDRRAEACTLDSIGHTYHQLGRYKDATTHYGEAIELLRRTQGVRYSQALVLIHLGDNHHAAGERDQAGQAWRQALAILDKLNHPDAKGVRDKLAQSCDLLHHA